MANDKIRGDVFDLYLDRARLHRNAYQHKTIKVVDRMMIDALLAADESLDIVGGEKFVKMSEAHEDLENFLKLSDDYVMRSIQVKGCFEAQQILERIFYRKSYKIIYKQEFVAFANKKELCENEIEKISKEIGSSLDTKKELSVICRSIDYGKKSNLKNVVFFKKDSRPEEMFLQTPESIKQRIPAYPDSVTVLVVSRSMDERVIEEARKIVNVWRSNLEKEEGNKVVNHEELTM